MNSIDRAAIERAIIQEKYHIEMNKKQIWEECKENERITSENIEAWKTTEFHNNSINAATLKHALSSSSSFTKSMLEYEKAEKSVTKIAPISKLSEFTSFKV